MKVNIMCCVEPYQLRHRSMLTESLQYTRMCVGSGCWTMWPIIVGILGQARMPCGTHEATRHMKDCKSVWDITYLTKY